MFCAKIFQEDNPYNVEYLVNENDLDQTHGQEIKMDQMVLNNDVLRVIKMMYDITPDWGNEYFDTVSEFFHPVNLTSEVRDALRITI